MLNVRWMAISALFSLNAFATAPETVAFRTSSSSDKTTAQLVRASLERSGFRCAKSRKTRAPAIRCRGRIAGYSKPLNYYVPDYLTSQNAVTIAYHFHGFWTHKGFDPFHPAHGDFATYLTNSGRNAILVVPESAGKDETYAYELSTPKAMTRFFINAETPLNTRDLRVNVATPRVLTGHSGAYVQLGKMGDWAVAGAVPHLRSVRGVGLFDSVYGGRPGLAKFMKIINSHDKGQYFSAYSPANSAGKNYANNALQRELGNPRQSGEHFNIMFVRDNRIQHMMFMKSYMTQFLKNSIPESAPRASMPMN